MTVESRMSICDPSSAYGFLFSIAERLGGGSNVTSSGQESSFYYSSKSLTIDYLSSP